MPDIAVVTSCSANGWTQYGRRFVETFGQYWPAEVRLLFYTEDTPDDLQPRLAGFPILSLYDASPEARAFAERHRGNARAHGKERHKTDIGWTPNKVAAGYNFRYDAFRFAKKVFSVEAAAREVGGGRLFWVDADVVTFAPVPPGLLDELLPPGAAISALLREGYHPECGFVGYDLENEAARAFIAEFARLYASDEVFALQEWHDSWVFEWLRKKMGVPTHAIPHCSRRQPFAHAPLLSKCLDHCKGPHKALGRTPKHLRTIKDDVAYWR
mgnify:CR=1 FL=1